MRHEFPRFPDGSRSPARASESKPKLAIYDGPGIIGAWLLANPYERGEQLHVIASNGENWDHVSVSTPTRCPTWPEMEHVRHVFFGPDELVIQYSMPRDLSINRHSFCLHMWRPHGVKVPVPPRELV